MSAAVHVMLAAQILVTTKAFNVNNQLNFNLSP